MTSTLCARCLRRSVCRLAGTVLACFARLVPGPHRVLNRRYDPLRRLSPADWSRRLRRFATITPALICACNRLRFDYEQSAPATADIRARYRTLAQLPPKDGIRDCLVRLGYPPVQADRAVHSYGSSYRVRNQLEINAYARELAALSHPEADPEVPVFPRPITSPPPL